MQFRFRCYRTPVWEDALIGGLITTETIPSDRQNDSRVVLTEAGIKRLGAVPSETRQLLTTH